MLMGAAEKCSILYLESRCVSLARAMGVAGRAERRHRRRRRGGLGARGHEGTARREPDGDAARPRILRGQRQPDLRVRHAPTARTRCPCCSRAPTSSSRASGRSRATTTCSARRNFNAEDMDDCLVLQRDWGVDGGLRTVDRPSTRAAASARSRGRGQAVYRDLGLADFDRRATSRVVVGRRAPVTCRRAIRHDGR